jgi:translocator protein
MPLFKTRFHEGTRSMTLRPSHQVAGLLAWIAICFAAAGLGGLVTAPHIPDWYAQLAKPAWTPPSWVFGPVWSCLYLMMAISAWLVWRQNGLAAARLPIGLFALQLALNSAWSVLFFGLHRPGAAFLDILLLWIAIAATVSAFGRWSRWASLLLVPYLTWVSFAAMLNLAIWRMNA